MKTQIAIFGNSKTVIFFYTAFSLLTDPQKEIKITLYGLKILITKSYTAYRKEYKI